MENQVITVTITDIVNFGAFCVAMINDVQYKGLIHISEISDQYVSDINDFLTQGQQVDALILSVDEDKKQLKLSLKRK